jgi:hypothetical protein
MGRIVRAMSAVAVAGGVVLVSGCATTVRMYEGPELPPSQAAILKAYSFTRLEDTDRFLTRQMVFTEQPMLIAFDGEWTSKCARWDPTFAPVLDIQMLPGEHALQVYQRTIVGTGMLKFPPQKLSFCAEAGRVYRLFAVSGPPEGRVNKGVFVQRRNWTVLRNLFGPLTGSDANMGTWQSWIWIEDDAGQRIAGVSPSER